MGDYSRHARCVCRDGFSMSVQAHDGAYCEPRADNAERYTSVEIGYPNDVEPFLLEYAEDRDSPTNTVYPYVPSDIVRHVIDKHGGMIDGSVPRGVPVWGALFPKT